MLNKASTYIDLCMSLSVGFLITTTSISVTTSRSVVSSIIDIIIIINIPSVWQTCRPLFHSY